MSSSDRFMDNPFQESTMNTPNTTGNSFANINEDMLAAHLQISTYDQFQLTDAVRPALDLKIKPTQGYRHDVYIDEETGSKVPVIMVAASKEILFPLFMDLVGRLGPMVDVVLETSHNANGGTHIDLYREHMDAPVLESTLWDFEDLLLNDGCCGIAVLNPNTPQEVQFDEHKLLIIYGSPLEPFEFALEKRGVHYNPDMQFITEAEHIHSSSEQHEQQFNSLRTELGLDGSQEMGREDLENEDFDFQV